MLSLFYPLVLVSIVYVLLAVYIDLKERVIPDFLNYVVILACFLVSFFQSVFFEFTVFAAASFVFAYVLYKLGVWGGGDVKFFVGLNGLLFFLTGFGLPGVLYLFLLSSILSIPVLIIFHFKELLGLRGRFSLWDNFKVAVGSSISSAGLTSLLLFLNINLNISVLVFVLLLLVFFIVRIPFYLGVVLLLAGFYFYGLWLVLAFVVLALVLSFLSILLIQSFSIISKEILRKKVKVKDLKEGMISAQTLYVEEGAVREAGLSEVLGKALKGEKIQPLITSNAEGLTKKDIKELKNLKVDYIVIKESFPFAPLLGVGFFCMVFLWILVK